MKQILFSLIFIVAGCQSKHFTFDKVDYFHIDLTDYDINQFSNGDSTTNEILNLESLIYDDYPNMIDKPTLLLINKFYNIHHSISENELLELKKIYVDSYNFKLGINKCQAIYRDILVFKQNDSIVGLSKICFDCDIQYTIDKYGYTKEFDGDCFEKLKQILK